MRDPADRPDPPAGRPARHRDAAQRPRFTLPVDHHDERASERVEAFLDGPVRGRRSRPLHLRSGPLRRPRPALPLDTRTDWEAALHREDARIARYARPAAVLVVELVPADAGAVDRVASRVGTLIRAVARETDRVARVGPTRFHVLLPETTEPEAALLGERVRSACASRRSADATLPVAIRTAVATPTGGGTLAEALRVAQRRLDPVRDD